MSVPDYIRTEWKSRGCANLRLASLSCPKCISETNENFNCETYDKLNQNECIHSKAIECFISTFNVWEFKEEQLSNKNDVDAIEEDVDAFHLNEEIEALPPTISPEIWALWKEHWTQWKDIYINTSWVKRFRKYCDKSTTDWYDENAAQYPHVISYVNYCEDLEIKSEAELITFDEKQHSVTENDVERNEILDKMYEDFISKRYWVHFKLFLRDLQIIVNEDLEEFFSARDIVGKVPPLLDQSYRLESKETHSEIKDDSISDRKESGDSASLEHVENDSPGFSDLEDELAELKKEDKEYQPNCNTKKSSNAEINLFEENPTDVNTILTTETSETDVTNESNEAVAKEIHVETNLDAVVIDNPSNVKAEEKVPKSKKKTRKQNTGVAWALKRLQVLGDDARGPSPDIKDLFVFGIAPETPDILKNKMVHDPIQPSDIKIGNESLRLKKRKHEVLEDAKPDDSKDSYASEIQPYSSSKWISLKAIFDTMSFFRTFYRHLMAGILNYLGAFFGGRMFNKGNPLFGIRFFSYFYAPKDNPKNIILKIEKKSFKSFKKAFGPTVRQLPFSIEADIHLTLVKNLEDSRPFKENLVQVTHVNSDVSDDNSGLFVMYMTENDVDQVLSEMAEISTVPRKENEPLRTRTLFDEDGSPQEVMQVPTGNGKTMCIQQEDYVEEKSCRTQVKGQFNDWLYWTNISFDDDGNPVPMKHSQSKESWHNKVNKVLQNCRLMRLYKFDVLEAPKIFSEEMVKYWHQRYRLFLRFDEGIKLDYESWYSVTPEMISGHHAERLACDVVVDAFCGCGGNAIQLAATCNKVIAIDIDASKLELARHNAKIYGVEDRIEFVHGDFFQIASKIKGDCILLSPPWGGIDYLGKQIYDVLEMDGGMDAKALFGSALNITSSIALYLPKNSNLLQIAELAQLLPELPRVDIEFCHISNKRKGLTAYFGDLVDYYPED